MSQKWVRSKRWDDENIPAWAFPVKAVLRTFSSIWLAVILLVLVAVYGTLASVPIGLLAKIPTVLIYGLTAVGAIVLIAALPTWGASRLLRSLGVGRAGRFAVAFILLIVLSVGAVAAWHEFAWPRLRYDARTGGGLLLFSEFVYKYQSTTLRRLPGMEMSELEFYSWWPLRVILLLFITNMVVATLRRIEFIFVNLGVLTVHTGIVTIALGSIYYAAGKQEGDMLLRAGPPDAQGRITAGATETGFYDNTDVVLWLGQGDGGRGLEQRPIRWLPRYNDYGLNALGVGEMAETAAAFDEGRTLDIPVPPAPRRPGSTPIVDPDLEFNVVGYASYAELEPRWVPSASVPTGDLPNPMRRIELLSSLPTGGHAHGEPQAPTTPPAAAGAESVVGAARFLPDKPAERIRFLEDAIAIEYTRQMPESRWRDLTERLPEHVPHALVVEVPDPAGGAPHRQVYAATKGARIVVGQTGYTIEVEDVLPRAPFPIITPGYQGADSSVALVRVTPPDPAPPFTRYIYHRFPAINQDMLDETGPTGMPLRRDADPAIRIGYIDASVAQVYLDELAPEPGAAANDPAVRALVRLPGREPVVVERVGRRETIPIAPMVGLRLGERWAHATSVQVPRIIPDADRDKQNVGTHREAAVAVRVSRAGDPGGWSETVWVPFSQYLGLDAGLVRTVRTPDGREASIAFGRRRHALPGLALQLVGFEMFPYPHSDLPQDYRSDLLVLTSWRGDFAQEQRPTSLNAPLLIRVPFEAREEVPAPLNFLAWLITRVAPNQYKFSQAGWDAEGWRQSKALADQGQIARPFARFTILGVGNNPGIYIVAAGAIMMSVGIPWAFYVKPLLVQRRKRKIQAELTARAGGAKGAGPATGAGSANGAGAAQRPPTQSQERAKRPAGAEL